jgi:hypothetical protein
VIDPNAVDGFLSSAAVRSMKCTSPANTSRRSTGVGDGDARNGWSDGIGPDRRRSRRRRSAPRQQHEHQHTLPQEPHERHTNR